jgi:site-specific DNA-methyltransferase (adenine-specific)
MPPKPITENTLFYGDNLPILREYVPTESVDLVYLDPPFNSNRSYNVLFRDESGHDSESQIVAFDDTWHWGDSAEQTYHDLVNDAPAHVGGMIGALRQFIGTNQMMAYLVMMAARLVELHRVLKPTGSLYLHCDPTASHYLKLVMDTVFGPEQFRNEITWLRHNARSTTGRWPRIHDVLFFYSKGQEFTFRPLQVTASANKIPHTLITGPEGHKYQTYELTAPGVTKEGESGQDWRGYDPSKMGRHWANSHATLDAWDAQGFIHWPSNRGFPRRLAESPFVAEARTVTVGDVWTDVDRINQSAAERLGYPTQKPLALLERIIQASSNPGDVVLDPFCGCGTAVAAAQKLERRWIGIDITHLSISLQKYRLAAMFPGLKFQVIGEPEDLGAARQLAGDDRYQFQWWALSLIRAKPLGGQEGSKTGKKGSDKGVDGVITFIDDNTGKPKRALVQVKSGHINAGDVRDLIGTVEQEKAALGLFITLEPPTAPMETAAVTAGYYHSPGWNQDYRRIQILTIESLLKGAQVQMPPTAQTFKLAPKAEPTKPDDQLNLGV